MTYASNFGEFAIVESKMSSVRSFLHPKRKKVLININTLGNKALKSR